MRNLIITLFVSSFLLTSCGAQETAQFKVLSTTEYEQAIAKEDIQIVDVRTAGEYSSGHIKDAINIDVSSRDFESKISELNKDEPIYIYCRSGARSARAARTMESLGFTQIYDLRGGILSWKGELIK